MALNPTEFLPLLKRHHPQVPSPNLPGISQAAASNPSPNTFVGGRVALKKKKRSGAFFDCTNLAKVWKGVLSL